MDYDNVESFVKINMVISTTNDGKIKLFVFSQDTNTYNYCVININDAILFVDRLKAYLVDKSNSVKLPNFVNGKCIELHINESNTKRIIKELETCISNLDVDKFINFDCTTE